MIEIYSASPIAAITSSTGYSIVQILSVAAVPVKGIVTSVFVPYKSALSVAKNTSPILQPVLSPSRYSIVNTTVLPANSLNAVLVPISLQ